MVQRIKETHTISLGTVGLRRLVNTQLKMGPHIQFINLSFSLYDIIDYQVNILQSEKDRLM